MLNPGQYVSTESLSQLGHQVTWGFGSSGSTSTHSMNFPSRSARNPSVWIQEISKEDVREDQQH